MNFQPMHISLATADRHLGWSYNVELVNSAAVNNDVRVLLQHVSLESLG